MRTDEEGRKRQPIDASSSRRGDETKAISSKEFFLFIIYSTVRGCSSRRRLLSSLTIDNSSAVAGLAWQQLSRNAYQFQDCYPLSIATPSKLSVLEAVVFPSPVLG